MKREVIELLQPHPRLRRLLCPLHHPIEVAEVIAVAEATTTEMEAEAAMPPQVTESKMKEKKTMWNLPVLRKKRISESDVNSGDWWSKRMIKNRESRLNLLPNREKISASFTTRSFFQTRASDPHPLTHPINPPDPNS
ncbi:hypothetical protein U1Q18_021529 [Sarracenia purpurea var. burkii]